MDEELRAKYGRKWDRQHDDEDNKDNEDALEFFEKKLSDLLENIKAM
jgi:ubiquitin